MPRHEATLVRPVGRIPYYPASPYSSANKVAPARVYRPASAERQVRTRASPGEICTISSVAVP